MTIRQSEASIIQPLSFFTKDILTPYLANDKMSSFLQQHPNTKNLYQHIFQPWLTNDVICINPNEIKYIGLDDNYSKDASKIINWAYNYCYNPTSYQPVVQEVFIESQKNIIFGAVTTINNKRVLLMTLSVAHFSEVEFIQLYHDAHKIHDIIMDHEEAVEIKRFARHPIFNALKLNPLHKKSISLERHMFMSLWRSISEYMNLKNYVPFYILAPHVNRWFSNAGVEPVRTISTKLNKQGSLYKHLIKHFPLYWNNDPTLYQAPIIINK